MDLKLDMLKMANLMINCYFFKFLMSENTAFKSEVHVWGGELMFWC